MAGSSVVPQNLPPPQTPFVGPNGVLTKAGLDFLNSLFGAVVGQTPKASVSIGLVATGASQATALLLTTDWNVFTTVSGGKGALLQPRQAGQIQRVVNLGLNPLPVYPPNGSTIDALGMNNPYSLATPKTQIFYFDT